MDVLLAKTGQAPIGLLTAGLAVDELSNPCWRPYSVTFAVLALHSGSKKTHASAAKGTSFYSYLSLFDKIGKKRMPAVKPSQA
jgi:hypothetical protein